MLVLIIGIDFKYLWLKSDGKLLNINVSELGK